MVRNSAVESGVGWDIIAGFNAWPAWTILAWNDIQAKYRRTLLGPLWLTAGLGTTILIMGVVYPSLFGISTEQYVPYLTAGFLSWFFIVNVVTESSSVFVSAAGMIKQARMPLSFFVFQFVCRNVIIFFHNIIIYVIVCIIFEIHVGANLLLCLPAFLIYVVTGVAIGLLLGALGARFRDIPQIVASAVQVIFFLTPIFWRAENLPGRAALVMFNPFYHYVEILRRPLLDEASSLQSWGVVLGCTVVLCAMAIYVLARFRARVVFWV